MLYEIEINHIEPMTVGRAVNVQAKTAMRLEQLQPGMQLHWKIEDIDSGFSLTVDSMHCVTVVNSVPNRLFNENRRDYIAKCSFTPLRFGELLGSIVPQMRKLGFAVTESPCDAAGSETAGPETATILILRGDEPEPDIDTKSAAAVILRVTEKGQYIIKNRYGPGGAIAPYAESSALTPVGVLVLNADEKATMRDKFNAGIIMQHNADGTADIVKNAFGPTGRIG